MNCAVIQFAGSGGDGDCYHICKNILGQPVNTIFHKETFAAQDFDFIILPGGASHGDYLRPGALAARSKVIKSVIDAANAGKYILGIGNGFQILLEAGLLPGTMLINKDLKFYSDDVFVRVENNATPFTNLYKNGEVIRLTVACKYGNYYADKKTMEQLKTQNKIVLTYCDINGNAAEASNPLGSMENIAAIANQEGNILGLMPHPERCAEEILGNTDGIRMFQSILQYVEGGKIHDCSRRS
ncbi:phosphoribosylformylglycinamidine synthase subunit PurQ [Tepidanaerobacter acetatoxydans]|uniref:phosphoribosylformylglycinamidine synthase subunit PurQ n=1 Tax=Tepidanaerobacter acetatoxydans TaxID=499229 RepID=UPI001BD64B96|nr:phosphoribosylformylglycinamidine synthase subunit PurQ [Tepidanaerobacter acetatoxydans]